MRIGILVSMDTENISMTIDDLCRSFPKAVIISGVVDHHTTDSVIKFIADNELKILLIDEHFNLDYDKIKQNVTAFFTIEKLVRGER